VYGMIPSGIGESNKTKGHTAPFTRVYYRPI
jgi:hypothetical protein